MVCFIVLNVRAKFHAFLQGFHHGPGRAAAMISGVETELDSETTYYVYSCIFVLKQFCVICQFHSYTRRIVLFANVCKS